jgi:sugar phosphate isomerase/epimerase
MFPKSLPWDGAREWIVSAAALHLALTLRRAIIPVIMNHAFTSSRRDFLARAASAGAAAALCSAPAYPGPAAKSPWPVAIFSKVYQELKLNFDQAAELTAEAGLDGVDCPVRPKGEIEPAHAADELPRYAQALRKRKADLLLITSGIVGVSSPHAESVLTTAKKLGVQYYRLGFLSVDKKLPEIIAELNDLAALNKQIGMTAVLENHSGKYVGANLNEMHEIMQHFDPQQLGVALDLGHAIITHGDEWPTHFERLKTHIKVAYIKDVKNRNQFVPFGEGEFSKLNFFKRLKEIGVTAPLSMHIEFDWSAHGRNKNRETLLKAAGDCNRVLREWVADVK